MKKLLPLLLALCLTLSACAAPAAVPLPGDSVTAVTVTYAGKTVTCTDPARHVHLFLDASLQRLPAYSFHPNDNRSTVVISREEFLRYLAAVGNTYEFIELY